MDWRACISKLRISSREGLISRPNFVVVFPYTITLSAGTKTVYDSKEYTHSNYKVNVFVRSEPSDLNITAKFTSNSDDEAKQTLAAISFFKGYVKSGGPHNINPGISPPVLYFNYMGDLYNNVPVALMSCTYDIPDDVDHITVDGDTVPTLFSMNVVLKPQYSPGEVNTNFSLDKFVSGGLISKGYL